jgi:hypothetical protein
VIGKTNIREIQDILMDEIQYVLGNLSKWVLIQLYLI